MSDIRKNKGKEKAKTESKKDFNVFGFYVFAFTAYRPLPTDDCQMKKLLFPNYSGTTAFSFHFVFLPNIVWIDEFHDLFGFLVGFFFEQDHKVFNDRSHRALRES